MITPRTAIETFLTPYDLRNGSYLKEIEDVPDDSSLPWVRNLTLNFVQWMNVQEAIKTQLEIALVSNESGKNPLFNLRPNPSSKDSASLIKDVKQFLNRALVIPKTTVTTEYIEWEFFSWLDIETYLERFGQFIAGLIQAYGKTQDREGFLDNRIMEKFTTIRRRLQKDKQMSEMDAYIYIYKWITPYIGASTFIRLYDTQWRRPNWQEFFSTVTNLGFDTEFNIASNELWVSEKQSGEFFFYRDAVLLGCSNQHIEWVIYPFIESKYT